MAGFSEILFKEKKRSPQIDEAMITDLIQLEKESGQANLLDELANAFEKEGKKRLDTMRAALMANDRIALSKRARSMKSSFGSLGATSMHDICQNIEQGAQNFSIEQLNAMFESVELGFNEVKEELREILSKRSKGKAV